MTVYGLIERYKRSHPIGHFFDDDTLRFFGERISDMRVLRETVMKKDYNGNLVECYVLSSLQRKHPMGARRHYSYFSVDTFDEI